MIGLRITIGPQAFAPRRRGKMKRSYACHLCQERCDCVLCKAQRVAPELLALVRAYATTYPLDGYQDTAQALIARAEGGE